MKEIIRWMALALVVLAAYPASADVVAGDLILVSSQRVTRTEFDYTYRLSATNNGAALRAVRAEVTSSSPHTQVLDGTLTFGDLAAGSSATSQDTFAIRHDRRFPFDTANLSFQFAFEFDRVVEVHLEEPNAVEATVGAEGGVLQTIAANGTRLTLTIPPGALVSSQPRTIRMTPVTVDGLPASGGFVAGAQFAPDGLILLEPATLTIELPTSVPRRELLAFQYEGTGDPLSFYPLYPADIDVAGGSASLRIAHFSGYGLGRGTSQDIASHESSSQTDAFSDEGARILKESLETSGELTPEARAALSALLESWLDTVVSAVNSATSLSALNSAMGQVLAWEAAVQGADLEGEFANEIAAVHELVQVKATALLEEINQRCLAEPSLCNRGPYLGEFGDALAIAAPLLGEGNLPSIETFCDGLINKFPTDLDINRDTITVGYGDIVTLHAQFRDVGNALFTPSQETLQQLGFRWETSPAAAVSGAYNANPLTGAVVEDGPITVAAFACGFAAQATIETTIDISGTWSGSGTETVSGCEHPEDNGTFSGSGSVTLTQNGSTISGSIEGTTVIGSISPGPKGTFTISGSMSGSDEGTAFTGSFTGSGFVNGPLGTLTVSWSGRDLGENETCVFSGSGTARR